MSTERKKFLDAIEADPYDLAVRKVYADWLDEHGADSDAEEAVVQRAWTQEKQEAVEWIGNYARHFDMDFDQIMEAAVKHLRTGAYYCLGSDTPEEAWTGAAEFWEKFALVVSGRARHAYLACDEDERANLGNFFRCAC